MMSQRSNAREVRKDQSASMPRDPLPQSGWKVLGIDLNSEHFRSAPRTCRSRSGKSRAERYGPYTSAYNRFNRWSRRGVWKRIFDALAAKSRDSLYLIDSTIVKAHRAASGAKGGRRIRRLASAVVGGPRKSMRSSMARVDH